MVGDAEFFVSIDGDAATQGGTMSASNALGQSQMVSLRAALAPGTHDVSASFLNDGSGGTPAADRNFYVKGIDINGQAVPGTTASLPAAGTAYFQFQAT